MLEEIASIFKCSSFFIKQELIGHKLYGTSKQNEDFKWHIKDFTKKKNKMGYFHVVISICFPAVRPSFMSANAIKLML